MKHLILSFTVLLSASQFVASAAENKVLPKTAGSQLETGVYVLSSDLTISASEAGQSALIIGENQTVTLYLKDNATLTLTGGAANGTTGAGAGILLPETSSLYVTGEGTIVATGGNAANGGNAGNGSDARVSSSEKCEIDNTTHSLDGGSFVNGAGGAGGNGGGGAGAGIGGNGGNGGAGGAGGTSRVRYDHAKEFHTNGNDGENGSGGVDGGSAGKFYVLGSVIVKAIGGNAGANGTTAAYGKHHVKIQGDDWLAAGGAPGGAGQGGAAAEAIGFGGRGGAGGGGGGSGGFFQFDNIKDNTGSKGDKEDSRFRPGCGRNGWEGNSAEIYKATTYDCYDGSDKIGSAHSGFGGKAGAIARNGNPGELHSTPTTSLTLSPEKPVEQLANVAVNLPTVTLTFQDGGTVIDTKSVALGAAFPTPPTCSKHEGEVFTGWYMDERCCYDASGVALLSASPLMENVTLNAKWIPDVSILEVKDEETLKKAISALAADATLVDKSGQRRVAIKDNIKLAENLIIPASVEKLQLLGPATISSDSAVEISAEGAQVYAENLTLKNLDIKAQKLTLFNVAVSGEISNTIKASPLLASSTTMESVKLEGHGLLVNTTVEGVTVEDGADYRFVNVTQVGGAEIADGCFINSLSVSAESMLNEITLHGVTHKYFGPTAAALEGAVEIYYEPTGENIAKMVNGEKVAIIGHAALATRCLTLDQLGNVRKTPTKGAIRLISEQPTLAIEAKTEEGQYVAKTISIDYAATSVNIPDGSQNAEVVTTPYALVAATVDALISETDININGEAVVAMAKASGIAANNLVVNGDSFSANSLDEMSSITLEDAALEGGELQWFGSANLVKADLNSKTFSGGSDFKKTDPLTVAAKGSRTETLASVTSDALAQIAITTTAKAGIKLKVVSSGYEWTDSTPVGSSGKTATKIYTIPLRKGEHPIVVVTNGSGENVTFTLSAQYIYFGVEE